MLIVWLKEYFVAKTLIGCMNKSCFFCATKLLQIEYLHMEKKQQTILSTSINHEMLFTSPPHFSRCHSTVPRYIYHAADMSIWWKFNKNGSLHLKEICIYLASPLNFPHAQNTFVTLHNFAPKLALLLVPLDITRCKLSYDMRVFLQYNEMSSRHFTLLFVDIIPSVNITSPNVCRLPWIFPAAVVQSREVLMGEGNQRPPPCWLPLWVVELGLVAESCTNIGSLYIICQHNSSTP